VPATQLEEEPKVSLYDPFVGDTGTESDQTCTEDGFVIDSWTAVATPGAGETEPVMLLFPIPVYAVALVPTVSVYAVAAPARAGERMRKAARSPAAMVGSCCLIVSLTT